MLACLRKVHPELDTSFLKVDFGGPTGGRPHIEATEEANVEKEEDGPLCQ